MAENQGVLGDQWNDYANRLLKLLGWEHIGDKDMDITGSGGETYGIDAIARYDQRILSRLTGNTVRVWFEGEDLRMKR